MAKDSKMKTLTVKFHLGTGFVGANHEDEVDIRVPKDADDGLITAIIQEEYNGWMYECINTFWEIKK